MNKACFVLCLGFLLFTNCEKESRSTVEDLSALISLNLDQEFKHISIESPVSDTGESYFFSFVTDSLYFSDFLKEKRFYKASSYDIIKCQLLNNIQNDKSFYEALNWWELNDSESVWVKLDEEKSFFHFTVLQIINNKVSGFKSIGKSLPLQCKILECDMFCLERFYIPPSPAKID